MPWQKPMIAALDLVAVRRRKPRGNRVFPFPTTAPQRADGGKVSPPAAEELATAAEHAKSDRHIRTRRIRGGGERGEKQGGDERGSSADATRRRSGRRFRGCRGSRGRSRARTAQFKHRSATGAATPHLRSPCARWYNAPRRIRNARRVAAATWRQGRKTADGFGRFSAFARVSTFEVAEVGAMRSTADRQRQAHQSPPARAKRRKSPRGGAATQGAPMQASGGDASRRGDERRNVAVVCREREHTNGIARFYRSRSLYELPPQFEPARRSHRLPPIFPAH